MPYYIPNTVSKTTCLGNSLSTFNISFTALDTNIHNLSVYTPLPMNYLSSTMVSVSSELTTKINYLSSTMVSVSGQLNTIVFNTSSSIMNEMLSLSNYTLVLSSQTDSISSNIVENYIVQGNLRVPTGGGTVNWDFSTVGTNAKLPLTANAVIANPTSLSAGHCGNLTIGSSAGMNITAYGSLWTFSNTYSSLNTAANATNIISYYYDGSMIFSTMVNF